MYDILAERSLKVRLKRFIRHPVKIINRRVQALYKALYDYCTKSYVREYKRTSKQSEITFNSFTPTEKKFPDTKIAVYTIITGGYDDIRDPFYIDDELDYYLVTDKKQGGGGISRVIPVPEKLAGLSSVKQQRYIKLHPDEILPDKYDYTIYIDADMRITCDIKPLVYSLIESGKSIAIHRHSIRNSTYDEAIACLYFKLDKYETVNAQMKRYKQEGFPDNLGLFETTIMIRKCNDIELNSIMQIWWQEIKNHSHRDQLSLQYALWKSGKKADYIFSLGNNVWKNPFFIYYNHNKKQQ